HGAPAHAAGFRRPARPAPPARRVVRPERGEEGGSGPQWGGLCAARPVLRRRGPWCGGAGKGPAAVAAGHGGGGMLAPFAGRVPAAGRPPVGGGVVARTFTNPASEAKRF